MLNYINLERVRCATVLVKEKYFNINCTLILKSDSVIRIELALI